MNNTEKYIVWISRQLQTAEERFKKAALSRNAFLLLTYMAWPSSEISPPPKAQISGDCGKQFCTCHSPQITWSSAYNRCHVNNNRYSCYFQLTLDVLGPPAPPNYFRET